MLSQRVHCPGFCSQESLVLIVASPIGVLIIEITRKVAVIVSARVGSIVPIEGSVAVLTRSPEQGNVGLEIIQRSCSVFNNENRLVGDSHTGVAHLAVLITPVGVVHIVAHKVIHLLGGSILCAPLSRRCHSHKRNPVLVVDFLLSSEIICERTVVNTFHPIISAKTGRNVGSK